MAVPLKNAVFEKVRDAGSMTDAELSKALAKDGSAVAADRLNKTLLDLEILGCVSVTWLTKDTRRIEAVAKDEGEDEVDAQNREAGERDYEASFPGAAS